MFHRVIRSEFVESMLCAGTLLSLCALIILGPRPKHFTFETQATVDTVGSTPNKQSFRIDASKSIRQSSAEDQTP